MTNRNNQQCTHDGCDECGSSSPIRLPSGLWRGRVEKKGSGSAKYAMPGCVNCIEGCNERIVDWGEEIINFNIVFYKDSKEYAFKVEESFYFLDPAPEYTITNENEQAVYTIQSTVRETSVFLSIRLKGEAGKIGNEADFSGMFKLDEVINICENTNKETSPVFCYHYYWNFFKKMD